MLACQKLLNCDGRKYIYVLLSTLISCNFKFTIYFFLCLTTWYRVHEKLIVTWLVSMCWVFRGTQSLINCVQRILSLFFLNEISSVHALPAYFKNHFNIIIPSLESSEFSFPSFEYFPTYLINQIIFGVVYKLWRCSYSFLQPLVMSPVLDPSIFHSTLLWNAFCLCLSPDVGDNFICTQNDKQNCSYVCFNLFFFSIRDSKAKDSGLNGSWHFLKLTCRTETT